MLLKMHKVPFSTLLKVWVYIIIITIKLGQKVRKNMKYDISVKKLRMKTRKLRQ